MMDFRGRRHERCSNWTDPEIVELLQLWSDESIQIELESSLRNQRVFDRIAQILRAKGIYRTGDQCREKIKKMRLEYRRIKDNHKMRTWKFYDVMDRVLTNRPAITYSSLGGAVIAQQVYQTTGGSDPYLQGVPPGSFGPASSGGFLFGQPPKIGDSSDIKCEDIEDSMLNSDAAPPEMYYGTGDEQETDGQSLLETEDTSVQADNSLNTRTSLSGFSDLNINFSAARASQSAGGSQDTSENPYKEDSHSSTSMKYRKRRRGGKTSFVRGSCRPCGQGGLDKALVSFLNWQQSAEERLLSLEEVRLEREMQAEERREQQEERRAEQERQHELRLFSMLTGALFAVRQSTPATSPPDPSGSPSAPLRTTNTPSVSSSLSQPPAESPTVQAVSTQETKKSQFTSVKTHQMSEDVLVTLKGVEAPSCSVYLSNRGNSIRQHQGILQDGFIQYRLDKHHHTDNPNGIINLGTSENKLCYDLLHARLTKPDMLHVDPALLQYPDWTGHNFLREEVAKFLTQYCCSPKPLNADNVVVMNGCGSLFSCIAAVICDPKDAILIPTPFYGVITEDLHLYSDVQLYHVPLDCEINNEEGRPFHLTAEKLEEGLTRAKQEGLNIRAVIIMNPHNPLAEIYSLKEMIGFLEFAKRNKLHAIIDEVYMLTVFDENIKFQSILSVDSLPDPQRTHVMWGLSKDFAMSGFRIGTLYSENRELLEALAQLGFFHGIPGPSQYQVARLLQDREWIDREFLPENRRRLKCSHSYLTGELRNMGVPFLDRPAALYVWADLRKYLRELSFEEELSLWRCFLRHKVLLSCGQAFHCSTPGWFRIVFADQQCHLQLGMKRMQMALKEVEDSRNGRDAHVIKGAIEEGKKLKTEDSAMSDNVTIISSTSSPESKSSDQFKERESPVSVTGPCVSDEFVLLDCQTSKPTENLDSLIGTLRHQIHSSDWLEKNTPELSAGEDPEILDVFKALLQRARK